MKNDEMERNLGWKKEKKEINGGKKMDVQKFVLFSFCICPFLIPIVRTFA